MRDVSTALTLLIAGPGRFGIQKCLQVFVTKAVEGMLASQHRGEVVAIWPGDRIESGVTLPLIVFGMPQAFEFSDGVAWVEHIPGRSGSERLPIFQPEHYTRDWQHLCP